MKRLIKANNFFHNTNIYKHNIKRLIKLSARQSHTENDLATLGVPNKHNIGTILNDGKPLKFDVAKELAYIEPYCIMQGWGGSWIHMFQTRSLSSKEIQEIIIKIHRIFNVERNKIDKYYSDMSGYDKIKNKMFKLIKYYCNNIPGVGTPDSETTRQVYNFYKKNKDNIKDLINDKNNKNDKKIINLKNLLYDFLGITPPSISEDLTDNEINQLTLDDVFGTGSDSE